MDAQCFSFRTSWVKGSLALLLTLCLGLALTQPALALPTWHIQTVDSAGIAGWHTSLVLDSSGNPVISYYDRTNLDLKLVHCSNATCSGVNSFQTVDSAGDVGQYTSLALDSSGNPVISYYDVTNGDLKLVHCGNATCSGVNTPQTVDSAGSVGVFNSLALDSSGNPVISYYDSTNFSLKLVHCSNATCSGVNSPQTLDSVGGVLWYSSLVLDSSGNPVISYYDLNNGDLKLVHCGNATCSGVNTPQTVDSAGNVGRYSSLALDSSGNPVISYLDFTNGDLKLVHCGNTTCSGVNSFQTVDSAGNVGYYTSLALDSSGNPVISYYDLGNGDLKLVHCGNTTCSSAAPQIVDSAGDVGVDTSLALDSSGSPVISYFDQSNQDLKLARLLDDTTPPTANPVQAPAANASGWTISENVTVNWNWTDSGSGLDVANCQTSSNSGTDLGSITIEAGCSDLDDNSAIASYMLKIDPFAPLIARTRSPGPNTQGWNNSAVTVSFGCNDNLSGVASNTLAGATLSSEGANQSVTNTGSCVDVAGNVATPATVSPINIDLTKPTISAAATTAPNANGWYNNNVIIHYTCTDALSGVAACPTDQGLSSEGTAVASLALFSRDAADNVSDPSNVVTVNIDKTAPSVLVTGVTNGAVYDFGSVPTAACSTSDALSGVATQATLSLTGGNGDGTGSFIATCSGATDDAGNSGSASVSYTVTTVVSDACTTTALRDNFNRANGSLGSNWVGLTGQSFYKIAGNKVDVQLGGPVVWKPTTFGVNQAAFVTLSTLDAASPSQGVLLKVQGGTIPTGGAIAVVYDSLAKAVRVSTLRLNTPTWTSYGNTPATFANGDKLLGCVKTDGTVRVYKNNSLLTIITLNSADQQFFNAKGGKIGLWTVAAPNLFVDDFGGGALTGVTAATLDATVPAELADDGTAITVAVDFPTDDTATAPDAEALVNRAFLPLVNR